MQLCLCKKWIIAGLISLLVVVGIYYVILVYFSDIPVLNYHQINNEAHNPLTLSASEFEAQMNYLHEAGYQTISPDQLTDYLQYGKPLPPRPVLITFDDGYEDNYQVAYPILQKYHFTATIFLITDFVNSNARYLTWEQIRDMHNHGIDFESHTLNHVFLTGASDEEVNTQLIKSKQALEWHLGQECKYLAYPGGFYDRRIVALAKHAGYQAAFTIQFGRDKKYGNLFTLNRIPIFEGSHTFLRFWLRLKFTPIITGLQNLKAFLLREGIRSIAKFIYIP